MIGEGTIIGIAVAVVALFTAVFTYLAIVEKSPDYKREFWIVELYTVAGAHEMKRFQFEDDAVEYINAMVAKYDKGVLIHKPPHTRKQVTVSSFQKAPQ